MPETKKLGRPKKIRQTIEVAKVRFRNDLIITINGRTRQVFVPDKTNGCVYSPYLNSFLINRGEDLVMVHASNVDHAILAEEKVETLFNKLEE